MNIKNEKAVTAIKDFCKNKILTKSDRRYINGETECIEAFSFDNINFESVIYAPLYTFTSKTTAEQSHNYFGSMIGMSKALLIYDDIYCMQSDGYSVSYERLEIWLCEDKSIKITKCFNRFIIINERAQVLTIYREEVSNFDFIENIDIDVTSFLKSCYQALQLFTYKENEERIVA